MIPYPHINPIAFKLGPIEVHWYGIMYLIGFAGGWGLALLRARKSNGLWKAEEIGDIVFYIMLGVIIGGRVGYMLFYDLPGFLNQPWILFKVWDGGMSFHGGLLGVALAMWLYSRKSNKTWMQITDYFAPFAPIGLGAGRIGNFINGELWGRVSHVPWAMVFPNAGPLPRHPSELYEFLLEGVLLFIILWFYSAKPRPRMAVLAMFLLSYGCLRFFVEFFRQPDPQYGFIAFGWLTMGQLLSTPMILIGGWMLWKAYRSADREKFISNS